MKLRYWTLLSLLLLAGCGRPDAQPKVDKAPQESVSPQEKKEPKPNKAPADDVPPPEKKESLAEARRGFTTKLIRKETAKEPVDKPPAELFRVVQYESPVGKLAAYLSPPPGDGKKHPAIIWIFGGFDNGIGDPAWTEMLPDNDQSGSAFRKAGILMMYPSLRGGNENPGVKEGFFGEVDDVLAASDFLAKQDYVDPQRIYLGGHSTGGTLVLLAAESSDRFRAVFSFGPVSDVAGYGADNLPFDRSNSRELELRSPKRWLAAIQNPVFVFEGTGRPGNLSSLQDMSRASRNPLVRFHPVQGATHFSILAPVTKLVAEKIIHDEGPKVNLVFTEEELNKLFAK
jgi:acetyl esterase/lipase